MNLKKRFHLFSSSLLVVVLLILAKVTIHETGLEFLKLDTLFAGIVTSTVFIIGFLLSSVLQDYKEAERMPAEIRMALEGVHDDLRYFAESNPGLDMVEVRKVLTAVVHELEIGLGIGDGHSGLAATIAESDKLSPIFARAERLGMSQNFVVRLRNSQDSLRRALYRIHYVQKMQFLPSVNILIHTLVAATLFLLLFLETSESLGTAFVFGFVSYMFVFVLHLVKVLEQPFRKGRHSLDDVSLFLLRDFVQKIEKCQ